MDPDQLYTEWKARRAATPVAPDFTRRVMDALPPRDSSHADGHSTTGGSSHADGLSTADSAAPGDDSRVPNATTAQRAPTRPAPARRPAVLATPLRRAAAILVAAAACLVRLWHVADVLLP